MKDSGDSWLCGKHLQGEANFSSVPQDTYVFVSVHLGSR